MSRVLPLVIAAAITSGTAGAALLPHSSPAATASAAGVSARSDTAPTLVSPLDWTMARRYARQALVAKQAADARAARAARAAADAQARAARAARASRAARAALVAARASRSRSAPVSYGSPRDIARSMLASRGWSDQFGCLDSLWQRESGWSTYAANSSGAYGIPQALPGSKMASAGSDWRTNPATQIRWGLNYIAASYGSPCNAWAHSQSHNWY